MVGGTQEEGPYSLCNYTVYLCILQKFSSAWYAYMKFWVQLEYLQTLFVDTTHAKLWSEDSNSNSSLVMDFFYCYTSAESEKSTFRYSKYLLEQPEHVGAYAPRALEFCFIIISSLLYRLLDCSPIKKRNGIEMKIQELSLSLSLSLSLVRTDEVYSGLHAVFPWYRRWWHSFHHDVERLSSQGISNLSAHGFPEKKYSFHEIKHLT